jgi:predicted acetyltransferase
VDFEIRTIEEHEYEPLQRLLTHAFSEDLDPTEGELIRKITEFDRTVAAYDGGTMVGTGSIASLEVAVPGTMAPLAGVTAIAVLPTHRRRGIMTAILRKQFEDIHDGRESIAGLFASEGPIYQRFGYGMGVPMGSFSIDTRATAYVRPTQPRGEVHILERDEVLDAIKPVYEEARQRWPGMLSRPGGWWDYRLYPHAHGEKDSSGFYFAVHQAEELDGYVIYRVKQKWGDEGPASVLDVEELVALTDDAYASLWRFCFDTDLVRRVEGWKRPADDPIVHMLAEPRAMQLKYRDGLWVRLVDVARALEARRYSVEGRLIVEVRDGHCPWNEGRVELEGGPEGARCRPTDAEPDLVVDVADLGATYLGGVSFETLARAGRVLEEEPGVLRRADAMFGWRPGPWTAHII